MSSSQTVTEMMEKLMADMRALVAENAALKAQLAVARPCDEVVDELKKLLIDEADSDDFVRITPAASGGDAVEVTTDAQPPPTKRARSALAERLADNVRKELEAADEKYRIEALKRFENGSITGHIVNIMAGENPESEFIAFDNPVAARVARSVYRAQFGLVCEQRDGNLANSLCIVNAAEWYAANK